MSRRSRWLSLRDHNRIGTADFLTDRPFNLSRDNDVALRVIADLNALPFKFAHSFGRWDHPIPIAFSTPIANHHAPPPLYRFTLVHSGPITKTKRLIANKA